MIYVDDGHRHPGMRHGRMRCSHMVADTLEELMAFGVSLGLKPGWLQRGPAGHKPHFDVSMSVRDMAVTQGAVEVSMREMVDIRKR